MTKYQAKTKIEELLEVAKDQYEFGGDENSEGTLMKGYVDFTKLEADIFSIVDAIADSPNTERSDRRP